jgi:hypothetical protein
VFGVLEVEVIGREESGRRMAGRRGREGRWAVNLPQSIDMDL